MKQVKFFRAQGVRMTYGSIFDPFTGELVNLKERGLDGNCDDTEDKHQWLLYPEWSTSVQQGGKNYLVCLNCGEHSHL
jgi:hypothetical protein